MARFDYPFKVSNLKFGTNLLANAIMFGLLIAIIAINVYVGLVAFIFKIGSKYLVSKYNDLKSFYPLFLIISFATICIHFISFYLYMRDIYLYKKILCDFYLYDLYISITDSLMWIYIVTSFICILAGSILTSATNKINICEEKDIRKKMHIYCWCINIAILIFTIMPCIYYVFSLYGLNSVYGLYDVIFLICTCWVNIISIILSITHIVLFMCGRLNTSFLND